METREHRRASAASSARSSVYSTQTTPVPVPETARCSQASFASRAWIFGKVPTYEPHPHPHPHPHRRPSNLRLEPVALRDSVAYPSASSFEATIEKGTARFGRRNSTKPRLVDLGHLRRTVKRMTVMRRASGRGGVLKTAGATPATLREAFNGESEGGRDDMDKTQTDERAPEQVRSNPPTNHQVATTMDHETQNDVVLRTKTESPSPRVPEMPFRDKIRGKHFSRTTGNLGEEVLDYVKEKRRGCASAQCVVI
ncbi:hypothetical protein F4781DRAFT_441071 [Annulohypoxylon bovei var. microspora]|nr:hypothetical protein F4781DRAFT_441071 [Annulohypoxylon bovei var. microspora]